MAVMKIVKSVTIDAPMDVVYQKIADFNHWIQWSPWLIMEPNTVVNVRPDGKYYEWNGKQVGSGNMTILNEVNHERIDCDLTFLKPWKSRSKVQFLLRSSGNQVIVDWSMESKLPFFLFWMKRMMEVYIGMDYDRGLRMLKELCEEGEVFSRLRLDGIKNSPKMEFIGIKTDCKMDEMGKKMSDDMPRLLQFVQSNGLEIAGKPFTQYHKWAILKNQVVYTSGIPVLKNDGISLPEGFVWGTIPETKAYVITHVGRYHHLGNAWSTAYMYQRNKEFRVNRSIHAFEVYVNDPSETSDKDLETSIYMPIR